MQRDYLKIVFVVLLAFLSLGVASAQGPKEPSKPSQTAKTGTHHHSSSSKAKDSNKANRKENLWPEAEEDRKRKEEAEKRRKEEEANRRAEEERRSPTLEGPTTGDEKGYRWVDLGLSVKWATCNVGANSPEEYGDYFAWGETEPYYAVGHAQDSLWRWRYLKAAGYSWESYSWGNSWNKMTKYCNNKRYWAGSRRPDNRLELLSEDDAAQAKWGGKWRMPTKAEFKELLDNCNKEWITYKGVKGYKFTSKKNGNSIFLPAAGLRLGTRLYKTGTNGVYWSSSLRTDYPDCAWLLGFYSDDVRSGNNFRYYGLAVRPVCSNLIRDISTGNTLRISPFKLVHPK